MLGARCPSTRGCVAQADRSHLAHTPPPKRKLSFPHGKLSTATLYPASLPVWESPPREVPLARISQPLTPGHSH